MIIVNFMAIWATLAQDVPPPPRPAGVPSSIDETAKLLQDKISSIGRLRWSETARNTTTNVAAGPTEAWEEVTHVSISPHTCEMRVAWKTSTRDSGGTYFLEELDDIVVLTSEERANRRHPGIQYEVSPTLYSVEMNSTMEFKVRDQATANQIATIFRQLAQQCKALPPPAAQSGPGLEETLGFIEDKLNQQGAVSWLSTVQNTVTGTSGSPIRVTYRISSANGDPRSCLVSYRTNVQRPGKAPIDGNLRFSLRRVEKLAVTDLQDANNTTHARQGHPELIESISPAVYTLVITDTASHIKELPFTDQDMANRVAKAMLHAVELCGGGKEPF